MVSSQHVFTLFRIFQKSNTEDIGVTSIYGMKPFHGTEQALHLYSGGARFKCRPGKQLSLNFSFN
jgi:hypothetical protein